MITATWSVRPGKTMADTLLSANFTFTGDFAKFEQAIQDKVLLEGAAAAAKVFYDEAKINTSGVREHPKVVTGNLNGSIYRAYEKEASTAVIKLYRISWNHTKAPHGHLIEFGTSKAPAYPFLRPAYDRKDEAGKVGVARMKAVMDEGISK
jgi:HK97 gp10 family phage protein